jgi:hypothetical protein
MTLRLEFAHLGPSFALALLPLGSPLPAWAASGPFVAVIQSAEGLSVICEERAVPAGTKARYGFHCLEIAGSFDIESVGVVSAAVQPLAAAGISVFVYSTWQTDYIFLPHSSLERAVTALRQAGHTVPTPEPLSRQG